MSNRTAFVTGGAQGIATTLGEHGFKVAVVDLNLDAAQATAASITDAGERPSRCTPTSPTPGPYRPR